MDQSELALEAEGQAEIVDLAHVARGGGELLQTIEHTAGLRFHDDLAPTNDPVYFYEFMQHGHRHGLQFLAQANVWDMQDRIYPGEVVAQLRQLSDGNIVLKEQYLDFLKNRRFRQTFLAAR